MQKEYRHQSFFGQATKNPGFTLLELLLSVAIFSLIVGPVTAVLIAALRNSSGLTASQNMMDSTRFALEYISRQARLPQRFDGTIPCANMNTGETYHVDAGGAGLTFINSTGQCVYFYLSGNKIETKVNGSGAIDLTSLSGVSVSALNFVVGGGAPPIQPMVVIEIDAQGSSNGQIQGPLAHIETTVSSRSLNIQ